MSMQSSLPEILWLLKVLTVFAGYSGILIAAAAVVTWCSAWLLPCCSTELGSSDSSSNSYPRPWTAPGSHNCSHAAFASFPPPAAGIGRWWEFRYPWSRSPSCCESESAQDKVLAASDTELPTKDKDMAPDTSAAAKTLSMETSSSNAESTGAGISSRALFYIWRFKLNKFLLKI